MSTVTLSQAATATAGPWYSGVTAYQWLVLAIAYLALTSGAHVTHDISHAPGLSPPVREHAGCQRWPNIRRAQSQASSRAAVEASTMPGKKKKPWLTPAQRFISTGTPTFRNASA